MGKDRRQRTKFKEEKDGELQKLKDANRKLKSQVNQLKSEVATYKAAFEKNIEFLKGKTKDLSLKDLINGAKKEQNLQQIEDTKELTFKEMEAKWKCFQCEIGIMKLIVINRQDGKFYMRACSNTAKCKNRTELKTLTDDVEIS